MFIPGLKVLSAGSEMTGEGQEIRTEGSQGLEYEDNIQLNCALFGR